MNPFVNWDGDQKQKKQQGSFHQSEGRPLPNPKIENEKQKSKRSCRHKSHGSGFFNRNCTVNFHPASGFHISTKVLIGSNSTFLFLIGILLFPHISFLKLF